MAHTASTNPTPDLTAARAPMDAPQALDGASAGGKGDEGAAMGAPGELSVATGGGGGSGPAHGELTTTDPMQRAPRDGSAASAQKVSDELLIKKIVNQAVQDTIQDDGYSHDATRVWSNRIVESLVRTLVQMDRDNKYIVTCMIVQNLRQGMRSATSCFWNAQTDSGYSLTNERNGMYVITTVFICKA